MLSAAATINPHSPNLKHQQYLQSHPNLLLQQQSPFLGSKQQQMELIKLRDLNTSSGTAPSVATPSNGSKPGKLNGSNKINKLANGSTSGNTPNTPSGILKVKFPPKKVKQEKATPSKAPIKLENESEYNNENGTTDNIDIEYDDEHMQMQHDDMVADEAAMSDGEYKYNMNSLVKQEQTPLSNGGTPNGQNLEYECTACEKKFKYFCYYKRHMDACHSEWPKYVCETCSKSYKWEASFRQHLRSHHANLASQYGAMGSGMPPTQAELTAAAAVVGLNGGEVYEDEEEYIGGDEQKINTNSDNHEGQISTEDRSNNETSDTNNNNNDVDVNSL